MTKRGRNLLIGVALAAICGAGAAAAGMGNAAIAVACSSKSGDGAPKLDDNKPAGVVLHVGGKVAAKRDNADQPRALKLNDDVFANDTIFTDKDASVQILLHHNQAILNLASMKIRKLYTSAAWRAPKGKKVDDTAANDRIVVAGRHAERHAGSTTAIRPRKPAKTSRRPPPPPQRPKGRPRIPTDDDNTGSPRSADQRVTFAPRRISVGITASPLAASMRKLVVGCMAKLHDGHAHSNGTLIVKGKADAAPQITITPSNDAGLRALAVCVGKVKRWPPALVKLTKGHDYDVAFAIRGSR